MPRPRSITVAVFVASTTITCRRDDDAQVRPPTASTSSSVVASTAASSLPTIANANDPPLTPGDALWLTFAGVRAGEVQFRVEHEGPRPVDHFTVATYAYAADGHLLARSERDVAILLRPGDERTVSVASAPHADADAVSYEAIVVALHFADGATPWRDASLAPHDRPRGGAPIGGVSFVGAYTSTEGDATITQAGDRVTIRYASGHAHCIARSRLLACAWHEKEDYGQAILTRAADGKLHGTWGVGPSATDGGTWDFLPR